MSNLDLIKKLTITALLSDEELMGTLVLKGGNALDIAYQMSERASKDVDFSMANDFDAYELSWIKAHAEEILNREFNPKGFQVFDVTMEERPENIAEEVKSFWGGYKLIFKVIDQNTYDTYADNINQLRNRAILIDGKSPKFQVDISKYEYVNGQQKREIDGTVIHVYSPAMIALEKVRALCQQNPAYAAVIKSNNRKSRARDCYDIHNLVQAFGLDFTSDENKLLAQSIFDAKHVPLEYIYELPEQYEFHRQSWESVVGTVSNREQLHDFDYYFNFTLKEAHKLLTSP